MTEPDREELVALMRSLICLLPTPLLLPMADLLFLEHAARTAEAGP